MKCCHNSSELGKKLSGWNPFFVYILGFSTSLLVYQLGWSNIFPKISFGLLLFLLLTFLYSFLVGCYVYEKKIVVYQEIPCDKNISIIVLFIVIGFLSEFIYFKQIPLLSILMGKE